MYMKIATAPRVPEELTDKQKKFCYEYLKDLNACQAAKRAGYKDCRTQPHRMLVNARIQKFLAEQFNKAQQKSQVDVEFVLKELLMIANCDVGEAFNADGSLKGIHDIPVHVRKCISSFDNEELFEYVEDASNKGRKVREWSGQLKKVKFWPKDRCIEMLGKYLAMFVERNRFEDKNGNDLPAVQVTFIGVEPTKQDMIAGSRN
jgi:phage terminase small subunit